MNKTQTEVTVEVNVTIKETVIPAPKVDTLQCPNLTSIRRNGNTTRQVDYAIDRLFKGDRVIVIDHYGSRKASERLLGLIINRLNIEHGYFTKDQIDVDINKLEIELI